MANIKNNNVRKIDCRLYNDMYMDFMLSKDESYNGSYNGNCESIILDFKNNSSKIVVAEGSWNNAVVSDTVLENIGYTAVDNGLISYERDRIGNDEFYDLFVNSKLDLSEKEDKFFVNPVTGNTQMLSYPIENNEGYKSLKGGFYQGFFKIEGDKYQTLPHIIDDEWCFKIKLRPRDYETPSNILNKRNPDNEGMFFYIGTRAENKFWELYKKDSSMEDLKTDESSDYNVDYDFVDSTVTKHQYHEDIPSPGDLDDRYAYSCDCDDYFGDGFDPYGDVEFETDSEHCTIVNLNQDPEACKSDYFEDDYTGIGTTACECPENGLGIDDEYFFPFFSLENIELTDSKGFSLKDQGVYEIETDNKFLIFNQTKSGFTINNWKDEFKFIITGQTITPNINYFSYLNQTKTGYTKDNIQQLIDEHTYSYDVFKDITNNAFALKLNDDGSISYRYLVSDCEKENGFTIKEESSNPGIVKTGEWSEVTLKMISLGKELMKIYIYVNGGLKLVSKELPILQLKPLNDLNVRQEGVPYSLSIGGGTQGLAERVFLDYYDITNYQLPLEKYFGGSFIGDVEFFEINTCSVPYHLISKK